MAPQARKGSSCDDGANDDDDDDDEAVLAHNSTALRFPVDIDADVVDELIVTKAVTLLVS